MKYSQQFFLFTAAVLLFWIIGGFNMHLSWEARLFKLFAVGLLALIAWTLKNSNNARYRKSAIFIVLLLAAGVFYAEPYASHLLFGHHHHHFFCLK